MIRKCLQTFSKLNLHASKVEELKAKMKKYQELSDAAYKLGDAEAYEAIQTVYRETFLELMAASFFESLYSILPHLIVIWLLSFKFGPIQVGNYQIGILLWYPAIIIPIYMVRKKLRKSKELKSKIVQECTG